MLTNGSQKDNEPVTNAMLDEVNLLHASNSNSEVYH